MKVTKQCSECGGREIYVTDTFVDGHTAKILPGIQSFFSPPKFEVYVCGNCGLHQMFIKTETLEKVKESYKRYN